MSNETYSPFECLAVAETTGSGLLQLLEGEVELSQVSEVELRSETPLVEYNPQNQPIDSSHKVWEPKAIHLQVSVTTHRLVALNMTTRQARYIHLSNLFSVEPETLYFKSPKIVLSSSFGELLLAFPHGNDRTKKRDELLDNLKKSLQRKVWEETSNTTTHTQRTVSKRRVGVDAILRNNQNRHAHAAQLTNTAFDGDAETLLKEATALVRIIQKYVATLDSQKSDPSQQQQQQDQKNDQLVTLMNNMGMTNALDKRSVSQEQYFETTARQLCDFLLPRLDNGFPMLTLTDVYCLFNRARGTNLLSPQDLYTVLDTCERLQLGLHVQTFASGLKVVAKNTTASNDNNMGNKQLLQVLERTNYLTATMVSRQFQIPVVLATEQLRAAVQSQLLVVDETLEQTSFYPNRFDEFLCATR